MESIKIPVDRGIETVEFRVFKKIQFGKEAVYGVGRVNVEDIIQSCEPHSDIKKTDKKTIFKPIFIKIGVFGEHKRILRVTMCFKFVREN